MAALPGRVRARVESCLCLELFMWLVNQHRVHWRRNRLLQQFALSPWDSYPERLVNTVTLCLITSGCLNVMFGGGRGENTPMWNVQTQDIAQTGNQRTVWCAFLPLSVVQIDMLIPVFSSSCGYYSRSEKGTYCKEDWKFTCPSAEANVYKDKQTPKPTELYCSMAHNSHNAF